MVSRNRNPPKITTFAYKTNGFFLTISRKRNPPETVTLQTASKTITFAYKTNGFFNDFAILWPPENVTLVMVSFLVLQPETVTLIFFAPKS